MLGVPSAGDVLTIAFDQCRDIALREVSATPTSVQLRGSFSYNHLTRLDGSYTSAIHGATDSVYTESVDPMGTTIIRLDSTVAAGGLVGTGTTPTFNDTFTYDAGFRAVSSDSTPSTATPAPSSTIALNGTVHVASIGGRIRLETHEMTQVHHSLDHTYPDSGQVMVHGKLSHLRLTVMNTERVRCELDHNDDGVMDQSHEMLWTELMP